MSLSKRLRFDIFKRDNFTCGYCGSKPPNIILEVDHILAIANGGSDDAENLITSCFDCNRGKSDQSLNKRPQTLLAAAGTERDRLEQLKAYQEFLEQKTEVFEAWMRRISDAWVVLDGKDPTQFIICGERARTVRSFLKRLPAEEIIDALHIAYDRISHSDHRRFKFFCGVCWTKFREANGEQ